MIVLEFLEVLYQKEKHIVQGVIIIYIDNKYVYKRITSDIKKPSLYALDAGVEIIRMHEIIKTSPFEIIIELITKPKIKALYKDNPGPYLIL